MEFLIILTEIEVGENIFSRNNYVCFRISLYINQLVLGFFYVFLYVSF